MTTIVDNSHAEFVAMVVVFSQLGFLVGALFAVFVFRKKLF